MVNEYFKRIESEIQYPIRHRRKVPFDPSIQVAADFSRKAMDLRRLDSELDRFILRAEDYLDLVVDSYTSNIHQSTKLEGNPLPLEEVRRLTRNSFEGIPHGPLSEPRQEILNHIVSWVRPEAFTLPWTMPKIQGVHQTLLRGVADEK